LHPWLRSRVCELADLHNCVYPERALCLIWAHRSKEEQQAAYKAGRSRLDGVRRFSLHNLIPSLAADLWVYTEDEGAEDAVLFEDRPPKGSGLSLQLLQRGSLKTYYYPMARLSQQTGLEAGAFWRRLKDGPHVQVPKTERHLLVQAALNKAGASLATDGDIGPKTRSAIDDVSSQLGVPTRRSALLPISPSLWAALHEERG
jgi:hypothetical protein